MSAMRRAFLALVALSLLCAGATRAATRPDIIAYDVAPEFDGAAIVALDVTLRLDADASGTTRLALPDQAAGMSVLWRYVRDLKVEGAARVTEPDPATRVIASAPNAPLLVRYRVVSALDHDPAASESETYRPIIRPRWFWAYGEALFAAPKGPPRRATFHWSGGARLPFASDLEHAAGRPMSMDDLLESVLVGGPDLTLQQREVVGAPVRIATIGRRPFTDAEFADTAAVVIGAERRFWGGREGPFLVVLAPLVPTIGRTSIRGEGRGDAFAILGSADAPLANLKTLIAHEYFHTWNPPRLGGLYDGPLEPGGYWFSEGFTDFYARRLLLRGGVYDLAGFAEAWNETLRAYAASSARETPGAKVLSDFWTNSAVEQLPYQRGAILAAIWDQRLRSASNDRIGLDQVLSAMRAEALRLGRKGAKAPDLFVAIAHDFGLDVGDDLDRVVNRGQRALLPADVFGPCLDVRTLTVPAFDPGYQLDRTGPAVILKGVQPGSPAYAAGLRDGMRFVRREGGIWNDPRTPLVLRVIDAGGVERTISYRPEGGGTETLQDVVVRRPAPPDRACLAQPAGIAARRIGAETSSAAVP